MLKSTLSILTCSPFPEEMPNIASVHSHIHACIYSHQLFQINTSDNTAKETKNNFCTKSQKQKEMDHSVLKIKQHVFND